MVTNEYSFELDLKHRIAIPKLEFVAGDKNSSILNITLTNDGQLIDISNSSIQFNVKKADNKLVLQDSTNGVSIINAMLGEIKITLQDQSIAAVGENFADISIIDGNNKITTKEFKFTVRANKDSDEVITSTSIVPLLERYKEIYDQATKENVSAELVTARTDSVTGVTYTNLQERLDEMDVLIDDITSKRFVLGMSNGNLYYRELI